MAKRGLVRGVVQSVVSAAAAASAQAAIAMQEAEQAAAEAVVGTREALEHTWVTTGDNRVRGAVINSEVTGEQLRPRPTGTWLPSAPKVEHRIVKPLEGLLWPADLAAAVAEAERLMFEESRRRLSSSLWRAKLPMTELHLCDRIISPARRGSLVAQAPGDWDIALYAQDYLNDRDIRSGIIELGFEVTVRSDGNWSYGSARQPACHRIWGFNPDLQIVEFELVELEVAGATASVAVEKSLAARTRELTTGELMRSFPEMIMEESVDGAHWQEFTAAPANDINCRCTMIPITEFGSPAVEYARGQSDDCPVHGYVAVAGADWSEDMEEDEDG